MKHSKFHETCLDHCSGLVEKEKLRKNGGIEKNDRGKKRRGEIWFKVSQRDFSFWWDSSQKIYFVSLFFSPADRREIPQRFLFLFWDFFAAGQRRSLHARGEFLSFLLVVYTFRIKCCVCSCALISWRWKICFHISSTFPISWVL